MTAPQSAPPLVRRWVWGVADQAVVSCVNMACGIAVARSVSQEEFGAFTLALTAYWVSLGMSRALTSEPYAVRFGARAVLDRSSAPAAVATAFAIGLVAGAVLVVVSVPLSPSLRVALAAVAVVLPLLLLQDVLRSAAFAARRPVVAVVGDAAWLLTFLTGWLTAGATGHGGLRTFVLVWGLTAGIGSVIVMYRLHLRPRVLAIRSWVVSHRDITLRFLIESLAGVMALQLYLLAVAMIVGLDAVGSIRAAQVFFGPWQVLLMGTVVFGLPESARVLAMRGPGALFRFVAIVGVGLALVAVACGGLLAFLPDSVGREVVGASWTGAEPLVVLTGLSLAPLALISAGTLGLRALAAVNRSLPLQLATAALIVSGAAIGAAVAEASGALVGVAIAGSLATAGWWWQLRAACHHGGAAGADPSKRNVGVAADAGT